jgi:hypothetical protein
MSLELRDSLAQVQELFRETSGNRWAAEGARVVSDPEYKVYKGHIADCVEDDDAAFIAACHQLFRDHIPALLAMMDDHSPDAGKMGEDAVEAVAWAVYGESDEYGPTLIPQYCGSMGIIRDRVMEGARREGFNGNFVQRMADLGWWVEPLFAAAKSVRGAARAGERG